MGFALPHRRVSPHEATKMGEGTAASQPSWLCAETPQSRPRRVGGSWWSTWRTVCRSVHTWAVATALPELTVRRHRGWRFAASLGALLFAVTICAVLFRIVSVEYWRDPVTGWYIWVSGTAFVLFGTLIFLDREQRANGLLLIVFGILEQGPWTGLMDSMPVWAIFLLELSSPVPWIVLSVVLLRFPERRLQKRYERIFLAVMTTWLLVFRAIHAVAWPCWATPRNVLSNGLCGS